MTVMTASQLCKLKFRRSAALLVMAAAMFTLVNVTCDPTKAQNLGTWKLEVSEKEMKLEHPTDMMWDKWLMWDTSSQREDERNMPYFQLTNEADSTAPLMQLRLFIGDTRFNFAPVEGTELALLGSIKTHTITSSTVGNLGDELIVNIGEGGLAPGEKIRFKINLNVDPSFEGAYTGLFGTSDPDFRTILFDMNGKNVYDPGMPTNVSSADNATVQVVFDPSSGPNFESNELAFADETVPGPVFFNNLVRQYGLMDSVLIFDVEGGTGVIPEPSGFVLAFLAMTGVLALRSRRTR
jgi:hypothetical protein